MRVLAFRHERGVDPGTIQNALESRGIGLECVDLFAGAPVPETQDAAGLVFLGGVMCANDPLEYLRTELDLIRSAAQRGQPVLGICLGAQLIAKALGASVKRGAASEIGWRSIELDPAASADPVFADLPSPTTVFQLHNDTLELPDGATRLAHSPEAPNQAFRWGRSVYGVQFHPEMTEQMVREWSADSRLPEWPETPARCVELARTCDRIVGGWSTLLEGR